MANLASTYWNQGQLKKAEELQVQVLEIRKQVLGPEHPGTLTSMANLAHTWKSQSKVQSALSLLKECVHLRNRVLGQDHPHARTSFNTLRDWETAETRVPAQQSDPLDPASDKTSPRALSPQADRIEQMELDKPKVHQSPRALHLVYCFLLAIVPVLAFIFVGQDLNRFNWLRSK
ncbi:hypothetical protein BDV06DRAFT_203412 [Aspergillus oleicola]